MPDPVTPPAPAPAAPASPVPATPAAPVAPASVAPAAGAPASAPGLLGGEPPAAPAPAAAPASPVYEPFKIPEGVSADAEILGQFGALAGAAKLPQEQAQAIVDLGLKMAEKQVAAITEAWQAQRTQWVDSLKADPDWGGSKFAKTVEDANRAFRQFGDKELISDLKELGLDSHPGLVRAFARIAKATAEDRSIENVGGGVPATPKSFAETLYPNQGKA